MKKPFILYLIVSFGISCSNSGDSAERNNNSDSAHGEIVMTIEKFIHGKSIFTKYCSSCHFPPNFKGTVDPPMFDRLFERMPSPSEDYFIMFLQDSKTLKASGNEYAKEIDKIWNDAYEHNFKDSLTQNDFTNLITYFKIGTELRYQ